jgi:hypothetical protein
METKDMITTGHQVPAPRNLDELQRLAKMMCASGFFKNAEDIARSGVKILAGQELGIGPIASMTHVYFINGRLAYEAAILASAVKRKGYNYKVLEHTNKICTINFLDGGEVIGTSTFSIEDAKLAGLDSKDVWKKYPRNMLYGRAMSNGCRWYCADIFGGAVYTPEELDAKVSDDGSVIEDVSGSSPKVGFVTVKQSEKAQSLNDIFSTKPDPQPVPLSTFPIEEEEEEGLDI